MIIFKIGRTNRRVRSRSALELAVGLALALSTSLATSRAQTPATGVVKGRVIDPAGQRVGGARVVLDLVGSSGSTREITTNADGEYLQANLQSGQYTVTAEKAELAGEVFRVLVRPGRTVEVNFLLEPGRRVATWRQELEGRERLTSLFADGVTANRAGDYDTAIEKFADALKLLPTCVDCHFNLGIAYGRINDFANAEAAFKKAIEIKPDYATAYYGLADIYTRQKRPQEAAAARGQANRIALQALAANRGRADESVKQGIALLEAGNAVDARRRFEEALRHDSNFIDAHYWLGTVHLRSGDSTLARRELNLYLQLDPNGRYAQQARAELQKLGSDAPRGR